MPFNGSTKVRKIRVTDEGGPPLPEHSYLNFIGPKVSAYEESGDDRITIQIDANVIQPAPATAGQISYYVDIDQIAGDAGLTWDAVAKLLALVSASNGALAMHITAAGDGSLGLFVEANGVGGVAIEGDSDNGRGVYGWTNTGSGVWAEAAASGGAALTVAPQNVDAKSVIVQAPAGYNEDLIHATVDNVDTFVVDKDGVITTGSIAGGGGGSSTLAGDTDANISSPANNDTLQYQTSDSKWHNIAPATARTNLGLGTLATQSGTFSGTSSGTNTGDQTLSDATISTTDITTNNVSTTKHGFAPKAPNDTTKFLRGDATWAVPASGGSVPSAVSAMALINAATTFR